jgi:hypothetical protein
MSDVIIESNVRLMIKNITKTDLISYYYNECSASVKLLIENSLESNSHWKEYLNHLELINQACDNLSTPNNTSLNIILEESAATEQHSF